MEVIYPIRRQPVSSETVSRLASRYSDSQAMVYVSISVGAPSLMHHTDTQRRESTRTIYSSERVGVFVVCQSSRLQPMTSNDDTHVVFIVYLLSHFFISSHTVSIRRPLRVSSSRQNSANIRVISVTVKSVMDMSMRLGMQYSKNKTSKILEVFVSCWRR